jgi:myosin-15
VRTSIANTRLRSLTLSGWLAELEIVGQLLKISPEGLGRALTTRTLVVSGQKIQVNFKAAQAADARDALAKAIYSKLFDWCVLFGAW